ncbi:TonB-dependent receptor [Chitinimonas sp.]|uniref:TonB-dependent receptor n=1 Tax=Chitinimonas sp. TaxID=1934313 RepID=UPI0035B3318A
MKIKPTPIASAVALALLGISAQAADNQAEQITVTGIRASKQNAIAAKRNADSHVEVISAEDIGKMPDKNVADSLARVAGVTISSAGATEGGFDENDRVSMRGTGPSLTQTLINGHNVSSGDWFVLNQGGSQVGRSVSYSLLPSELVQQVVVHKGSEARFVEGGTAGNVDILTRRPLEFKKQLTGEASIGAVYADLPKKTDPQFNALFNWKNDSNTFGVLVQGFSEKRHLRREGQETLGYNKVTADSALGKAIPALVGSVYPYNIGTTLFEQTRTRKGGVFDVQYKPNADLTLGLNGYFSNLDAPNYNRNYLYRPDWVVNGVGGKPVTPTSYTLSNGVITSMTFPAAPKTFQGEYDMIYRPDESASSNYVAGDFKWRINDRFRLSGQLGQSVGHSKTPTQDMFQEDFGIGTGSSYSMNGLNSAINWTMNGANSKAPGASHSGGLDWMWGDMGIDVKDTDRWAQIDGAFKADYGLLTEVLGGIRFAEHEKGNQGTVIGQRPGCAGAPNNSPFVNFTCTASVWDSAQWPQQFGTYTISSFGGNFPNTVYYYTPEALHAFNSKFAYRGVNNGKGNDREDWGLEAYLKEKRSAAYVEGKFEGDNWSGNVGLRLVHTREHVRQNYSVSADNPAAVNAVTAFGAFAQRSVDNSYTDVLPSLNLKVDLTKHLVARFGVSKTMTLPDYGSLASSIATGEVPTLDAAGNTVQRGSGSGGNPLLKPVRANNFDMSLEYYFAPRSLVSASVFVMDLQSYVGFGTMTVPLLTSNKQFPNGVMALYDLTVPVNISGSVHGVELAWEQPIWGNFGAGANYTFADGREDDGRPLNGNSKHVYNLNAYYEDDTFNARIQYNYRSEYFSGIDRSQAYYQDGVGTLSASLGYKFSDRLSFTLDGQNLNNPTLKYYSENKNRPRAFYRNGRQYYLNAHIKF